MTGSSPGKTFSLSDVESQHVDPTVIAELQEVMEDEFSFLISTFLKDTGLRIVDIQTQVKQGDPTGFSRACHSLKGSATNLGAIRLASLCRQGEVEGREGIIDNAQKLWFAIDAEFAVVETILKQYVDP